MVAQVDIFAPTGSLVTDAQSFFSSIVIRFSSSRLSALLCGFKRSLDIRWLELAVDPENVSSVEISILREVLNRRKSKNLSIGENEIIESASERKIKGKREVKHRVKDVRENFPRLIFF